MKLQRSRLLLAVTTHDFFTPPLDDALLYPDSDGKPMAENTEQYRWIVTIKENLERQFRDDPQVFIAADLFWYPIERTESTSVAP
ncbi:hypothetical protein [Trichothermofontia sp.]